MDNDFNTQGTPVNDAPADLAPRAATKREYLKLPENIRLKKNIRLSAWICYICAALTLVVGLFVSDAGLACLLDVAILVVLGIGIHVYQSRACAVILSAYALLNVIYTLATTGKFSGYIMILAAVYALMSTFTLEKQWKAYQQESDVV